MRLFLIFLVLAVAVLVPFLIWGEGFDATFSEGGARAWLERYGGSAWAAAIVLLVLDLVLPVPATAVMSALGLVYGAVIGGCVGSAGSFLAGATAYGLCRGLGRPAAIRIAGEKDLLRGERLFSSAGGWAVALSRWLPLLPEVITCMAGLARMPARQFFTALACGSVPMAFTFSTVGALGVERPALAIGLSALLPLALWPLARWLLERSAPGPR